MARPDFTLLSEAFLFDKRQKEGECGGPPDSDYGEQLAAFTAAEGVVFIGSAQEKTPLFRTEKRRDRDGRSYPWIVKSTGRAPGVVN